MTTLPSTDNSAPCAQATRRVLFTASIMGHLTNFHVPYMQYFKDNGFDVHAATGAGSPPSCVDRHLAIPFERSPFKWRNLKNYRALKRLIDSNGYDVIHCHTPVVGVLTRLAARKARKRGTVVIYTAHGFHFYKGAPRISGTLFRIIEKWLCRCTDVLITINTEDYDAAHRYGFKPARGIFRIPGVGADGSRFAPCTADEKRARRVRYGIHPEAFVLIFAGEYSRDKNQLMLLNAVKQLKETIPSILLLLPGRGPMESELKRAADALDIADNVWVMGYRTDMDQLLGVADVAVSSSVREGLGINLVEAMAAGLPVVATRIRGHADLVADGENGFLVSTRDPIALASRVRLLYQNPTRCAQMAQKAKELVTPFLLDNARAETLRIYETTIKGSAPSAACASDKTARQSAVQEG